MRVEGHKLIAECTAYDFKSELERKKIRDWLKSISAILEKDIKRHFKIRNPRRLF